MLLPTDSNKLLLQWRGPFEIVEVLNRVDYRVNVNGYIHTYHANILRLYVERKTEASHCLLSAEASMSLSEDDDDESDEYSLEDCTFPSNKEIETYRDVSISDELTDEQKKEVKELLAKYPDVLTSIPGKTELLEHDIKLSTAEPVRSKGSPYLACSDRNAFFTSEKPKKYHAWSCQNVCDALTFLLDNIFIRFGTKLYRQVVGIPMGTNCAPLVADLFLFCYERDFMMSLSDEKQADVIDAFNTTSRYLDEILNINNVYFDNMVS